MPVRLAHAHSPSPDGDATPFISTYYNTSFFTITIIRYFLFGYLFLYYVIFVGNKPAKIKIRDPEPSSGHDFRWPWRRGPPLTIPNREVKTVCADGTAIPSGRVGSRLFLSPLTVL